MKLYTKQVTLAGLMAGLLTLSACSDDEQPTGTGKAPAAEQAAAPQQEQTTGDFERAPGVVYQDEIYKNWPYQSEVAE